MYKPIICAVFVLSQVLYISAEFTKNDCTKDVEEGPISCLMNIRRYKWDDSERKCVQAMYGGCRATENNFKTEEECYAVAASVCKEFAREDCTKDVEIQPSCRMNIPVYKWDDAEQKCVEAVYGGCRATDNNFETKEECYAIAAPVCKKFTEEDCTKDVEEQPSCRMNIPVYKWDDSEQTCVEAIYGGCRATYNNFETKEECYAVAAPVCKKFTKEDCTKDVEEQPSCRMNIPVYKWDDSEQTCVEAIYGGCRATDNNFGTKEECYAVATPVCKKFTEEDCSKDVEGEVACRGNFEAYRWDVDQQKCIIVHYGGCNPTPNNFQTEEACEGTAAPVCKKFA